jgi:hypothetical protein
MRSFDDDAPLNDRCGHCDGRHPERSCPDSPGYLRALAAAEAEDRAMFAAMRQAAVGVATGIALFAEPSAGCPDCAKATDGQCDACWLEHLRAAGFEVAHG